MGNTGTNRLTWLFAFALTLAGCIDGCDGGRIVMNVRNLTPGETVVVQCSHYAKRGSVLGGGSGPEHEIILVRDDDFVTLTADDSGTAEHGCERYMDNSQYVRLDVTTQPASSRCVFESGASTTELRSDGRNGDYDVPVDCGVVVVVPDASTPDAAIVDASTNPDATIVDASTNPDATIVDASTDASTVDAATSADADIRDASPVADAETVVDAAIDAGPPLAECGDVMPFVLPRVIFDEGVGWFKGVTASRRPTFCYLGSSSNMSEFFVGPGHLNLSLTAGGMFLSNKGTFVIVDYDGTSTPTAPILVTEGAHSVTVQNTTNSEVTGYGISLEGSILTLTRVTWPDGTVSL